jgi:small subunit ribosomal protein S17e
VKNLGDLIRFDRCLQLHTRAPQDRYIGGGLSNFISSAKDGDGGGRLGKIRTAKVKRVAREMMERYGNQVSTSFEENKVLVRQVLTGQVSKKFANKVAGYLTRLAKLAQRKAAQEQVQAEQG